MRKRVSPRGFSNWLKSLGRRVLRWVTSPDRLKSPLFSRTLGVKSWMGRLLLNSRMQKVIRS